MSEGIKPIRRVVTGNDEKGRSRVLYDSPAPRVKASAFKKGTGMTDIWMYESSPAPLEGDRDDGNLPFHFEPPENGGRLRIVQSDSRPAVYDPARDEYITPEHPPRKTEGGTWERGRQNLYTTRPPWFDTMTASAPQSAASFASSAVSTPFASSLCGQRRRSPRKSSQVSVSLSAMERPMGSAVIFCFISVG